MITTAELIIDLFDKGMIKFGDFTLKSGERSHIYIDVRSVISHPSLFRQICLVYVDLMSTLTYDFICGVPYSALALASAVAYHRSIPMILKRKEEKTYGTKKIIEGCFSPHQSCIVLEDVITTGGSVIDTIKSLRQHDLKVNDVCVLIDRNQGAKKLIENNSCRLHSITNLDDVIDILSVTGRINEQQKQLLLTNR